MRRIHQFLVACAALSLLTGCPKKPQLDPGSTVVGPTSPREDFQQGGPDLSGSDNLPSDFLTDQGLENRDPLDGNQVRGVFPTIYFDFDQSFIRPVDRPLLDSVAEQLQANPQNNLLVEGYCDWKGTTEYNLSLGDRRATSVKDYLVALGIDPSRIEILSKGDLEAVPDAGPEARAMDRKAELVLLRN